MARTPQNYSDTELRRMRLMEMVPHATTVREAVKHLFRKYTDPSLGFDFELLAVAVAQEVEYYLGTVPDTDLGQELWLAICDNARKGGKSMPVEEALRRVGRFSDAGEVKKGRKDILALIS